MKNVFITLVLRVQVGDGNEKQKFEQGVTAEMNNSEGAGDGGGRIVAEGTPEEIARCETSYTGEYLKKVL